MTGELKVGGSGASGSAWAISARRFDKALNYAKVPFAPHLSTKFREEPSLLNATDFILASSKDHYGNNISPTILKADFRLRSLIRRLSRLDSKSEL